MFLSKKKLLEMIAALEHKVACQVLQLERLDRCLGEVMRKFERIDDIKICPDCGVAFSPEKRVKVSGLSPDSVFQCILCPPSKYCPHCKPKHDELEKLKSFAIDNPDAVREAMQRHEDGCSVPDQEA